MSNILQKEKALEIANNFIEVFSAFSRSSLCSYWLSYPIFEHSEKPKFVFFHKLYSEKECEENKDIYSTRMYRILEWHDDAENQIIETYKRVKWPDSLRDVNIPEEVFDHNTYILFYKNQKYKMNIYNSPDCCGWNTTIEEEQYDESRYLLCTIAQYYDEEKIKFRMCFGFDVVSMEFLELFEITYVNKNGYERECEDIDEIQAELKNTKL